MVRSPWRDPNVQSAARNQTFQLRQTIVNECIEILQSHEGRFRHRDPRLLAIQIIGKFRASEAVDHLVRIIEYPAPVGAISEDRGPTLADGYPAAWTLISIGNPASRACIYELTKPNSPLRREKLCAVVRYVEGVNIGRILLRNKMRDSESDAERAILKKAICLYDDLFEK